MPRHYTYFAHPHHRRLGQFADRYRRRPHRGCLGHTLHPRPRRSHCPVHHRFPVRSRGPLHRKRYQPHLQYRSLHPGPDRVRVPLRRACPHRNHYRLDHRNRHLDRHRVLGPWALYQRRRLPHRCIGIPRPGIRRGVLSHRHLQTQVSIHQFDHRSRCRPRRSAQ